MTGDGDGSNGDGSGGGRSDGDGTDSDGSGSGGPEEDGPNGGSSDGSGSEGDGSSGEGGGASGQVSTAEKVVMALSVAFTLALFGFALWHAVAGPGAVPPAAEVVGSQPAADGGVIYSVQLQNRGDVGLVSATVSVECTDPPTELEFDNVPAQGHRSGSVRCPPGTSDPTVTVSDWVQE